MKIGIITMPLRMNYGGILQNYALQTVFRDLGHSPITFRMDKKEYWGWIIVGLVLISTEKGKAIFDTLPIEVRKTSFKEAISFNPAYTKSALPHRKRAAFYKEFNEGIPVAIIVEKVLCVPKHVRYIQRVKGVLKHILSGVLDFFSFSRTV